MGGGGALTSLRSHKNHHWTLTIKGYYYSVNVSIPMRVCEIKAANLFYVILQKKDRYKIS